MEIWRALLATALIMAPFQTVYAGFDLQKPMICAVDEVFECSEAAGCEPRLEQEANVPAFFNIEFDKKKVTSKNQDGPHRESDIVAAEELETVLIIKGTQNAQAWSMVIGREEGTMSATVSGDQFSFVMFGDCTALE